METVTATDVPEESALRPLLPEAYFFDAWRAPLNGTSLTPAGIFLQAVKATPAWVTKLMALRNLIVRQLGLKDVGPMTVLTQQARPGLPDWRPPRHLQRFRQHSKRAAARHRRPPSRRSRVRSEAGRRAGGYTVSTVVKARQSARAGLYVARRTHPSSRCQSAHAPGGCLRRGGGGPPTDCSHAREAAVWNKGHRPPRRARHPDRQFGHETDAPHPWRNARGCVQEGLFIMAAEMTLASRLRRAVAGKTLIVLAYFGIGAPWTWIGIIALQPGIIGLVPFPGAARPFDENPRCLLRMNLWRFRTWA